MYRDLTDIKTVAVPEDFFQQDLYLPLDSW